MRRTVEPRDPLPAGDQERVARLVVDRHGTTFAQAAGIDLRDEPGPLWQLFVLVQLLSKPIGAAVAVATARELFKAGWTTPEKLRASTWHHRVAALGRGGYRRYDFSTATRLDANATLLLSRWGGDLRRLRDQAGGDAGGIATLLREFDGIGPTGAGIFLREVQAVWPSVHPFADDLSRAGAAALGLPASADALAALVPPGDLPALCAGLVHVARTKGLADDVLARAALA